MKNLLKYLNYESHLLNELVLLAEEQQKALIKYNILELESIANKQAQISKSLREAEDERMKILMLKFRLTKKQAAEITLTEIMRMIDEGDNNAFFELKKQMKDSSERLNLLNTINRVLSNKALSNIQQMLSLFTNGTNHVCNVKI